MSSRNVADEPITGVPTINRNSYDEAAAQYRFQSAVSSWLESRLSVPTLPPDLRTPEIVTELEEHSEGVDDDQLAIESEQAGIELEDKERQEVLLTNPARWNELTVRTMRRKEVIAHFEKQKAQKQARIADLQKEKARIAKDRDEIRNQIRVAETINGAKETAALHLAAARNSLMAIRNAGQSVLSLRGTVQTAEIEKCADMLQRNLDALFAELRLSNEMTRDTFIRRIQL